jgi:hypothetical protein
MRGGRPLYKQGKIEGSEEPPIRPPKSHRARKQLILVSDDDKISKSSTICLGSFAVPNRLSVVQKMKPNGRGDAKDNKTDKRHQESDRDSKSKFLVADSNRSHAAPQPAAESVIRQMNAILLNGLTNVYVLLWNSMEPVVCILDTKTQRDLIMDQIISVA